VETPEPDDAVTAALSAAISEWQATRDPRALRRAVIQVLVELED
jgi:hypothetical protein